MKICSVIVAMLFAGLTSCAHSSRHVNLPASRKAYDEAFLIWLVQYHEDQDRKTQPCAMKQTIRQELRDFCSQSDQQHADRIERLRSWLKDWYNKELPRPDSHPLWMGTLEGQVFEKEFFREYLRDHDEGIEQTARCATTAAHPELRELCIRINPTQQKTDKQLRTWRCEWLKECGN